MARFGSAHIVPSDRSGSSPRRAFAVATRCSRSEPSVGTLVTVKSDAAIAAKAKLSGVGLLGAGRWSAVDVKDSTQEFGDHRLLQGG